MMTEERLEQLGMTAAANKVKQVREKKRKMMLAYEFYRCISPEKIQEFNDKLARERTPSTVGFGYTIKQLKMIPLRDYTETPPPEVLTALEEAINRRCFDYFEIAKIETVKVDPLLLGRIKGCGDRFYIAGWDDDVKIEDILKENEG